MILLLLLTLLFPDPPLIVPPWEPPQPVALPLIVAVTGGADVLPIVGADRDVVAINIRPHGSACWTVRITDQIGQTYQQQSRGCVLHLPLAAQAGEPPLPIPPPVPPPRSNSRVYAPFVAQGGG